MTLHYDIHDLKPYINWLYFHHAWQMTDAQGQQTLQAEATDLLDSLDGRYVVHALFLLADAHAEGDDIVLDNPQGRIPLLRQQTGQPPYLCLADFVHPRHDRVGLFATSADRGLETDFDHDPYLKMMAQLLADRLAEAAAERLHQQVRQSLWGYAADEQLAIADMLAARYQGIRPAVGYPSLPDVSLNFVLDRLLHLADIGITLTENGAMRPHASVSGLMLSHPQARYFTVGPIGPDQLADYARRRHLSPDTLRHFLGLGSHRNS